jgi:hypothetical protein
MPPDQSLQGTHSLLTPLPTSFLVKIRRAVKKTLSDRFTLWKLVAHRGGLAIVFLILHTRIDELILNVQNIDIFEILFPLVTLSLPEQCDFRPVYFRLELHFSLNQGFPLRVINGKITLY